ncbi:MAG: hypothetical protein WCI77_05580 [Candidatus Omnitrophota bacterium]
MKQHNHKIMARGQSITEYLIVLAAIIGAIVASTIGIRYGVNRGMKTVNEKFEKGIATSSVPGKQKAYLQTEESYDDSRQHKTDPAWENTDQPGGPQYTGGYEYEEWVRNNPDSAYNAPEDGKTLYDTGVKPYPAKNYWVGNVRGQKGK